MIRIFFSATVAFSIPVSKLFSFEAFWKGSLMGIGPCVLTRVLCAPCMGKARFVIGWAMVGRAEFAYLIAQMAAAGNMIDEKTFSICIWALLYATILAPFIFRCTLMRYIEREGIQVDPSQKVVEEDYDDVFVSQPSGERSDSQRKQKVLDVEEAIGKVEKELEVETSDEKLAKASIADEAAGVKVEDFKAETIGAAAPNTHGRLWWGRQPARNITHTPNSFICCLFFNKVSHTP